MTADCVQMNVPNIKLNSSRLYKRVENVTDLCNELQVERPRHLELSPYAATDALDLLQCLLVDVLGWGNEGRVTRVDPRILYVLRHSHAEDLAGHSDSINVYLLTTEGLTLTSIMTTYTSIRVRTLFGTSNYITFHDFP